MQRTMKSSATKTVVVSLTADNITEYDIDTNIFDDPYMEAATRAVEQSRKSQGGIIRPITRCWEKKQPKKSFMYNSYWILINASCYNKAEMLREKFRLQTEVDLAKEPIHARDTGDKS